jgi:CheY-like chemotaxis protein
MLVRLGYKVLVAETAREGIQLFDSHPGVDALITDVVMGEMNGFELADRLKIPTVFMSGLSPESFVEIEERAEKRDHFLQKPFTVKDLAEAVRETLDRE